MRATTQRPALAAVGYTTARRTALAGVLADLSTNNLAQQGRKGGNKKAIDRATGVLNAAYALAWQVSAASKIIYREEYMQRRLFRLSPGLGPKPGGPHPQPESAPAG